MSFIVQNTGGENAQEEYDSDSSHHSSDDVIVVSEKGRQLRVNIADSSANSNIIVTVVDNNDGQDGNNNEDNEDNEDDDDNNSNQLPQIEHVLRPAVVPLTCQRCRSTIHIITKSNPRYDPILAKQRQQQQQEQQLLEQQLMQQQNSPPKTPLSQSKFSSSLTRSGFLTRRKSINQTTATQGSNKSSSRATTPRGSSSSSSLSQSPSASSSSSMLQTAASANTTNNTVTSAMTSLTTLTRVRSSSNTNASPESQYALNVAANQRRFTILRDYPYQLISQEEYDQHLDYVNNQLFGYASDKAYVDELCVECLESVISEREKEYQVVHSEVESYQKYLSSLQSLTNAGDDENCDEEALIKELQKLEDEESEWKKKIERLQEEEAKTDYAEHLIKQEEQELAALEHKYWSEYNHFQLKLNAFQQERDALQQQLLSVSRMLDKLNATNALNDAFHIWFEGHFATINNFRLGRLQTQPVEWNEINAAWGQAVLLLSCLAKKMNYVFKEARIIPVGSFSKIEVKRIGGWTAYELYGGQGGLFWQSKYDKAQIAFLGCIRELVDHCCQSLNQQQDSGSGSSGNDYRRDIPYTIHGDQVGGISLRWGDDERWTRACKYLLTNLKWLIGIISFTEQ